MSESIGMIHAEAAPKAIGPYSQAVSVGSLVFLSGQIPLDPTTGELVTGGFAAEVVQVLANLNAVLHAAGCRPDRIVKVTAFLTDLSLFGEFNELYARFFGDHRPARAVVQVAALPRGARVEVEAVAVR
ncbi:MAG: RidA family protein [Acidobacteriota bacterium]